MAPALPDRVTDASQEICVAFNRHGRSCASKISSGEATRGEGSFRATIRKPGATLNLENGHTSPPKAKNNLTRAAESSLCTARFGEAYATSNPTDLITS